MNCSDCREKLPDYTDGALSADNVRALESHFAACPACRTQLDSLRALRAAAKNLPREIAPSRDLWPGIESELKVKRVVFTASLVWKLAAAAAIVIAAGLAWKLRTSSAPDTPAWQVDSLAGAPRVDSKSFRGESRLHVGQWLETDQASRVKVTVGVIGEVNVEPNSRVRLVDASASDHRLELARGELSARIWAPPRIFFVNTPSATAVDLGCAYTIAVDDSGNGTLRVTSGYVALQDGGRESIIPAGQMCATRRGVGPGTPFAADAPDALRRALDRFDFDHASGALAEILAQARTDDAVTLWHLLTRAPLAARGAVFDTLARDHAPPADVTRAGVIAGDAAMLTRWGSGLGLYGAFSPQKKI